MKIYCHRCFLAGVPTDVKQDCCDWGNCKAHCTEHHSGFGGHYDASWLHRADTHVSYVYKSEPSPGLVEEETETLFVVKDWPDGGSLDLEGELW